MRVERREGDGVSLTEALNSADLGCVDIPQPGCRELKRQRSDNRSDSDRRPRMTPSSLFEGLVDP